MLEPDEEGWIVASCPELPGCKSQGKSEAEAFFNIHEAVVAWVFAQGQKAAETAGQA